MNKKSFMVLSLVLGVAFVLSTAIASAASVWTVNNGLVKKILTVGTNSNKGRLLVKGFIRNPVKGKVVRIKDSVKVDGNIKVDGILQGSNIVSSDNLGTGIVTENKLGTGSVIADKLGTGAVSSAKIADDAVTSDKVDFSMDGVVKAAVKVNSDGSIDHSFCNIAECEVTVEHTVNPGVYTVSFGTSVSDRYIQVTPLKDTTPIISTIDSQSGNEFVIHFYTYLGADTNPTDFYVNLF